MAIQLATSTKTRKELLAEIAYLHVRLEEAKDALRAIGDGEENTVAESGADGEQPCALNVAGQQESMNEDAAPPAADGTVMYPEMLALLRESETRYRSLFENMQEGFAFCRMLFDDRGRPADFVYLDVNGAFGKLTGLEDVTGKKVTEVIPGIKESNPELFEIYGQVALTGRPEKFETEIKPLGIWLSISVYSPVKECFVTVFDNITEDKQAESELRDSEKLYCAIGESIDYGVWVCAPDGRNIYASESFLKLAGITQEQCSNFGWVDILHPDDAGKTIAAWKECVRSEGVWDNEQRFRGTDGLWHPILARWVPVRNERGELIYWAGINLDISRMKQAEYEMRASEERFRALTTASSDVVYSMSPDWSEMRQLIGQNFLADTVKPNRNWLQEYIPPDDQLHVMTVINEAIRTKSVFELEHRVLRVDGTPGWTFSRAFPLLDTNGTIVEWFGAASDVTARRRAEDELSANLVRLKTEMAEREIAQEYVQRLNRLYTVVSETNQAIIRSKDRESLFDDFCRIAVEDGGFKLAWVGLIDDESGEVKIVAVNGATGYTDGIRVTITEGPEGLGPTGIAVRTGTHYICNDFLGSPSTRPWHARAMAHGIRASASIVLKQEDRVIGALTLYADKKDFFDRQQVDLLRKMGADISFGLDNIIRDIRRLEAERALHEESVERLRAMEDLREKDRVLIQQSRQAAMGEMIGNIAHQWRQPLNTLGLMIQQLLLFYDLGEFSREFLDKNVSSSMEVINHMSRTIDDFRNYFRTEKEKTEFNAREAVANTMSLLEGSFQNPRISVVIVAQDNPVIYGYRNEFAQVLLNILINARDVFIERDMDEPRVTIGIQSVGDRTVVTIADNAGGVPEEIKDKIFDPYFTTKGPQQGTGVGLFMSKAIIEKNMGGILAVRNIDKGAEFRIEVLNGIHG